MQNINLETALIRLKHIQCFKLFSYSINILPYKYSIQQKYVGSKEWLILQNYLKNLDNITKFDPKKGNR